MRILIMSAFFFSLFYYFSGDDEIQVETIQLKKSAPVRVETPRKISTVTKIKPKEVKVEKSIDSKVVHHPEVEPSDGIPWDAIEKSWNESLRELLERLDPEKSESMYAEYLAEKERFSNEADELYREKNPPSEGEASVSSTDENMLDNLTRSHEEALETIFGDYFQEVKDHHQQYVDSLQHYNYSTDNEIEISVTL